MAEARQTAEWDRAAAVVAMVFNTTRSKAADTKPSSFFNPYAGRSQAAKQAPLKVSIGILKEGFEKAVGKPATPGPPAATPAKEPERTSVHGLEIKPPDGGAERR